MQSLELHIKTPCAPCPLWLKFFVFQRVPKDTLIKHKFNNRKGRKVRKVI
jgi:hypothetical protein